MNQIMIFLGVMFGVQGANAGVKKIADAAAKKVAKSFILYFSFLYLIFNSCPSYYLFSASSKIPVPISMILWFRNSLKYRGSHKYKSLKLFFSFFAQGLNVI